MARYRPTEADLAQRLAKSGYAFDDETVPDRIRILLEMCQRDLTAARVLLDDPSGVLGDQALQHLEEVGMRLGEALAFGLGYRLEDNSAGYHRRAIAVLIDYAAVHMPAAAAGAREFDRIRRERSSVKYPDDLLDYEPTTDADARRWLTTATAVFTAISPEPMRQYRQRHGR
ncbi:MAG: hypothetical protein M3406_09400 [Chloroflexota bacterium]|nr:hypothetical protein [Chloroflexota bacterium]